MSGLVSESRKALLEFEILRNVETLSSGHARAAWPVAEFMTRLLGEVLDGGMP